MTPTSAAPGSDVFDINQHEKKIYSQNGEDGILEFIFSTIGTTNKFSIEFGVGHGSECNTIYLLEKKGWRGLMMDYRAESAVQTDSPPKPSSGPFKDIKRSIKALLGKPTQAQPVTTYPLDIKNEKVTAENIQQLLQKYDVPQHFDLLSIDIDFNDYWVWKAITDYAPRVVVIEFNSSIPPTESRVVPYDPNARWDGTNYFGASLLALTNLGASKGYTLVGCDSNGVNAFFCKSELISNLQLSSIQDLYRPPRYGEVKHGVHTGHPASEKTMVEV